MNRIYFAAIAVLLLASMSSSAKVIEVDWFIPTNADSLPDQTAEVGDIVTFLWGSFHNVFIHPTKDCTKTGAIPVGTTNGDTYKFTADDIGEVVFSCDVGNHCENGQIMTFTVSTAKSAQTSTDVPSVVSVAPVSTSGAAVFSFAGVLASLIMAIQLWM